MGLVCNIGVSEKGKYSTWENGKHTKEYVKWREMVRRCYSEVYLAKKPTYRLCSIDEKFLNFQYFAEWCNNQVGFEEGWQLDKDLLVKGNKVYSEDTCVFLPAELNTLLLKSGSIRGSYPIGVVVQTKHNYILASCKQNNKRIYLGKFGTVYEAFLAYKKFKEEYIKIMANKYKETLNQRAYETLMSYEVSIDD